MKAVRTCCYPESDRSLSNLNILDSCFQTKLEKKLSTGYFWPFVKILSNLIVYWVK